MAGRGISIDILSNVRDALRGVGDVEQALGDVESTLDDMRRSGDSSTDKMSRGFRDLARDADNSADKVERAYKESYRDIGRAADDTADSVQASQRRMGERSAEVGQEIRQNLGEGIANAARGDFASLSDTIGDTLGGAVAGIGGVAAAGVAAAGALGVGAVVAAIQLAQEEQKKLNEEAGKWASAYESSAGRIVSAAYVVGDVLDQSQDADRFKEATEAAKSWGVDVPTAMRAIAGDATALATVQESMAGRIEESNKLLAEQESQVDSNAGAAYDFADSVNAGRDRLDKLNEAMELGQKWAQAGAEALYGYATSVGEATGKTDALGNQILLLPDGKEIVVDAQTQAAYEDLDAVEKLRLNGKTVKVEVQVDDTKWRNWVPVVKNGRIEAYATNGGRTIWD